jgi:CheY-like chemotaxis protein
VRVRVAKSAEDAVESMRRDGRPDLVLSDVVLPQRSGTDLIQHLRANPSTRSMKVVAVTTLADANTARRLRVAGFTDVIAKPIDPVHFAAQVARWMK